MTSITQIEEFTDAGKVLVLEDRSGSMRLDFNYMRGDIANVLKNNSKDTVFEIQKIGGNNLEEAFETARKQIPASFDKNAEGNKVIIYTDELQQKKGLRDFVRVCKEYNVQASLYFINPDKVGEFKRVDLTELNKQDLAEFTKSKKETGKKDRTFYSRLPEKALVMEMNEPPRGLNQLISNIHNMKSYVLKWKSSGKVGWLPKLENAYKSIEASPVDINIKRGLLKDIHPFMTEVVASIENGLLQTMGYNAKKKINNMIARYTGLMSNENKESFAYAQKESDTDIQ
jgi:hypothetical protein